MKHGNFFCLYFSNYNYYKVFKKYRNIKRWFISLKSQYIKSQNEKKKNLQVTLIHL